jgi:hypothetical protein
MSVSADSYFTSKGSMLTCCSNSSLVIADPQQNGWMSVEQLGLGLIIEEEMSRVKEVRTELILLKVKVLRGVYFQERLSYSSFLLSMAKKASGESFYVALFVW